MQTCPEVRSAVVNIYVQSYTTFMLTLARSAPIRLAKFRPHAAVIGSGFGGLAAAVRLGARGYRVDGAREARRARRPRLRVPAGRLHLRRRPDHHHRAVPVRGAVGAVRRAHGRRRRPAAGRAVLPHPLRRRRRLRLQRRRRRRCAPRWRGSRPADVAGYERFMQASEAIYRVGFEQLGHVPFELLDRHGARPARPAPAARATAASTRSSAEHVRDPRLRVVLTLPPAARRRQPVHDDLDLQPDRVPRAALGRALRRWAAPAAWCSGLVGLIEGQGGAVRCNAEVRADHGRSERAAHRRAAGHRRDDRRRHRGLQRRLGLDLPPPAPAPGTAAAGPTGASSKARYSMSLFVWYFGTRASTPTCRTTRSCSARATASCSTTSSSARCWRTTSASTCTARPPPTRRWRRPAATRSTCSRRCRTWTAAPTGRAGRAVSARDRAAPARRPCCPASRTQIVTSRLLTPQDFQDRLLVVPRRRVRPGAGADAERLVPAAQPQRGRRAALPRRRRHAPRRRPARRALFGPRSRFRVVPACSCLRLTGAPPDRRKPPTSRPAARCCATARAPSSPPRCCCRAACASRPRALYAFCRLADDAIDVAAATAAAGARARSLRERLRRAYAGRPHADRRRPRAGATSSRAIASRARCSTRCSKASSGTPPGRRYETLADAARLRRARGRHGRRDDGAADGRARRATALARACDLGVAMQLTNIARDVGEDARAGPPLPAARRGCARPASTPTPGSRARCSARRSARVVARAARADGALYARADAGIARAAAGLPAGHPCGAPASTPRSAARWSGAGSIRSRAARWCQPGARRAARARARRRGWPRGGRDGAAAGGDAVSRRGRRCSAGATRCGCGTCCGLAECRGSSGTGSSTCSSGSSGASRCSAPAPACRHLRTPSPQSCRSAAVCVQRVQPEGATDDEKLDWFAAAGGRCVAHPCVARAASPGPGGAARGCGTR